MTSARPVLIIPCLNPALLTDAQLESLCSADTLRKLARLLDCKTENESAQPAKERGKSRKVKG